MKHYALIGRTLVHSHSKELFDAQHFADADYSLCPLPSLDGLRQWVKDNNIAGFNVTNPYKVDILTLLDSVSPAAETIGAVNCVCVADDGTLQGHNTDSEAFRHTLAGHDLHEVDAAIVLGTGGASRAVTYALQQEGLQPITVSRNPQQHHGAIAYAEASRIMASAKHPLLVNATPVGTYPNIDDTPWPWSLPASALVYDLTYNPSPTRLLREAQQSGATTVDGSTMLRLQAHLSWMLWGLTDATV